MTTTTLTRVRLDTRYWLHRHKDVPFEWLARRVPKRVRYFVLIHAGIGSMRPDEEVPAVPFTVVLERFGKPRSEWRS